MENKAIILTLLILSLKPRLHQKYPSPKLYSLQSGKITFSKRPTSKGGVEPAFILSPLLKSERF